jgi:hypothetical protein
MAIEELNNDPIALLMSAYHYHGAATVLATYSANGGIGMVGRHPKLTSVRTRVMVETEESRGGLSTCTRA